MQTNMIIKPRHFAFAAAALLVTVMLWPATNNRGLPDDPAARALLQSDFDYYLDDVITTRFSDTGARLYRLEADRIMHFPDGDRAELTAPDFTRYPAGQMPVRVSSLSGELMPGSTATADLLNLRDAVVLERTLDSGALMTASTSSLQLDTATETASTAAPVTLESGNSKLSGTGMRITLADNRIELLADVRGTHE